MATWNQGCPWKKKLTHMRGTTAVLTQLKAAVEKLNDNYIMSDPALAVGTCGLKVSVGAIVNNIGGSLYTKTATANLALPACATVPTAKYGGFAFQIGADGTIDVIAASNNACGYSSTASAIAGLSAVAASHSRIGTLAQYAGVCNFVPGTSHLSGAGAATSAAATFTDAQTLFEIIGASITCSVPDTDI